MDWDLDKYLDESEKAEAGKQRSRPAVRQEAVQGRRPRTGSPAQSGKRRRTGSLPPWVLVLVCMLFYSFCFQVWTEDNFSVGRFLTLLVLSVGFALLTALMGTVGKKRKLMTVCAMVTVIFWGVMYLAQYFLYDSFKNFFTISAMLAGGENAGQEDFAARTTDLILSNFWRILLFAVPIVGWFLANRFLRLPRILTRGVRRYLAAGGVALMLLGLFFASVISPDKNKMSEAWEFSQGIHSFGLPVGLALDSFRGGSGEKLDIDDPVFTLPPDTQGTRPAQTEAPPQTDPNGQVTPPVSGSETTTTEPTTPPVPAKTYNMLDIDFDSIIANAKSDTVKDVARYLSTVVPSKTNAYTGMFKGKNLILITAEAFSKEFITPELTPTLYRMMTKGIQFTDYYQPAWGGSTSSGEFSVMTGIDPARGVNSIRETIGKNMGITVGNRLKDLGYFTRAYHNHTYDYYRRNETHENLGYEKYIGVGNGMEVTKAWPESDLEMIDFTVPQYVDHQPFSVYYMTVSGHGAYSWGGNRQSARHKDEVQNLPYSDTVKAYIACNLEVELAMESLLKQLEEAGIADDTLVVLTADHYPYCLTKSDAWYTDKDYLSEYFGFTVNDCFGQDHNCLIMWSGCLEDKNIVIDTPTFSLDICPTLCNLFGVDYDSRLVVGRDVFSDQEPIVFWPNRSWKTDKGQWDSTKADGTEFTPAEGVTVDQEYLDRIRKTVKNRINYSYQVLDTDFFDYVYSD